VHPLMQEHRQASGCMVKTETRAPRSKVVFAMGGVPDRGGQNHTTVEHSRARPVYIVKAHIYTSIVKAYIYTSTVEHVLSGGGTTWRLYRYIDIYK